MGPTDEDSSPSLKNFIECFRVHNYNRWRDRKGCMAAWAWNFGDRAFHFHFDAWINALKYFAFIIPDLHQDGFLAVNNA